MTNQQKLQILGAALHGRLWLRATARDLNVDYRQVQRWAKGEYDAPDWVIADLRKQAKASAIYLMEAHEKTGT